MTCCTSMAPRVSLVVTCCHASIAQGFNFFAVSSSTWSGSLKKYVCSVWEIMAFIKKTVTTAKDCDSLFWWFWFDRVIDLSDHLFQVFSGLQMLSMNDEQYKGPTIQSKEQMVRHCYYHHRSLMKEKRVKSQFTNILIFTLPLMWDFMYSCNC